MASTRGPPKVTLIRPTFGTTITVRYYLPPGYTSGLLSEASYRVTGCGTGVGLVTLSTPANRNNNRLPHMEAVASPTNPITHVG